MNYIFTCLFFLSLHLASAQKGKSQQINMAIGDTLHTGKCTGTKGFQYIDTYTKTRIPDSLTYNEETGEGFSEYYFSSGDFDGRRMLCTTIHQPLIIASYKRVRNKVSGVEQTLILAWINKEKLQIALIEIEAAWEAGEVIQ